MTTNQFTSTYRFVSRTLSYWKHSKDQHRQNSIDNYLLRFVFHSIVPLVHDYALNEISSFSFSKLYKVNKPIFRYKLNQTLTTDLTNYSNAFGNTRQIYFFDIISIGRSAFECSDPMWKACNNFSETNKLKVAPRKGKLKIRIEMQKKKQIKKSICFLFRWSDF